jgi:hypothetical protein
MFRFSKNKNQWGNIKRRKYNKEQINNPWFSIKSRVYFIWLSRIKSG